MASSSARKFSTELILTDGGRDLMRYEEMEQLLIMVIWRCKRSILLHFDVHFKKNYTMLFVVVTPGLYSSILGKCLI